MSRVARLRELLTEAQRTKPRNEAEEERLGDYCAHLVETIRVVEGDRPLTPAEFEEHFGHLPHDEEG